jgi:dihydrofolate synthase/folylpolyglutamate synthase
MTYDETIDFLYGSLPVFQQVGAAGYKPGLETIRRFDAYFDRPHDKFHTIHVAGTNGKGSVSHALAAILQQAGYKTGLYTSPHLLDFRERIKVDGRMIPQDEVVAFVENHGKMIEEINPSFFEMTVAMAFDYFARQGVDVAVVEVGMGGRLDATNIITPLLSVITNISHDHGQYLGDTLEQIATEKAGIIKAGVQVVIGETQPETAPIFSRIATEREAPICFADQRFETVSQDIHLYDQDIVIKDTDSGVLTTYRLDLPGIYQTKNLKTILASVEVLNQGGVLTISEQALKQGLASAAHLTGLSGRWQVLAERPLVVADTGHNEAGLREVIEQLRWTPHKRLFVIFGVVNDKDLSRVWPLLPREAYYIFTQATIERALNANTLAGQAFDQGLVGEVIPSIPAAIRRAQALATPDDLIFIGGSTFTVAEALSVRGL